MEVINMIRIRIIKRIERILFGKEPTLEEQARNIAYVHLKAMYNAKRMRACTDEEYEHILEWYVDKLSKLK